LFLQFIALGKCAGGVAELLNCSFDTILILQTYRYSYCDVNTYCGLHTITYMFLNILGVSLIWLFIFAISDQVI